MERHNNLAAAQHRKKSFQNLSVKQEQIARQQGALSPF